MIIKSVSNLIYSDFIKKIIFTILLMSLVFSRSFLGLYIFNYRIGEYLIAFALVLFLFTTFINFEDNPLKVLSVNLQDCEIGAKRDRVSKGFINELAVIEPKSGRSVAIFRTYCYI